MHVCAGVRRSFSWCKRASAVDRSPSSRAVCNNRLRFSGVPRTGPRHSTLVRAQDYAEKACQLSFLTIFCGVFPLMPLFMICANVAELHFDRFRLVHGCMRITPTQAEGIGEWLAIFVAVVRMSVVVNLAVWCVTMGYGWNFVEHIHIDEGADGEHPALPRRS